MLKTATFTPLQHPVNPYRINRRFSVAPMLDWTDTLYLLGYTGH